MFCSIARLPFLILFASTLWSQSQPEEYRVYTEHPRLFLRPQRLRLLKRERERQSMRWNHFDTLVSGKAEMAEPGFALGLYYAVTGDAATGKRVVEWALGPAKDLRQLALVYDWCQDALDPAQSKALADKIRKAIGPLSPLAPVTLQRNRALAAISIADQDQNASEHTLREVVEQWWKSKLAPSLDNGADLDPGADVQALLEMLHAFRDNLNVDLRSAAPAYFKTLPAFQVICNYPAPYPSTGNEYRIPIYKESGEPDLIRSALARAAGLATVAYDSNALETQFLQGWLIQDRFQLQEVFGAPYEFLWANPYQPGLSYAHLPLIFHDARSGSLFVRSNWDEDAVWFALYQGQAQLFQDGKIKVLALRGSATARPEPLQIGEATVVLARDRLRFKADGDQIFIIGQKPKTKYDVEVDDEELADYQTDLAGTLALKFAPDRRPEVRIQEAPLGSK